MDTNSTTPGRAKQAQAVVALILCVVQVAAVFGLGIGRYVDAITGSEAWLIGIISAAIGVVQSFVTSIRARKLKGVPTVPKVVPMLLIAAATLTLLAGCAATNGTSAGIWPAPFVTLDRDASRTDVRLLPDATDPNVFEVQTTHTRKDGTLPDIAFTVAKPSPETVVGTAKFRVNAGTPTP